MLLGIGIVASRRVVDLADFFVAGKKLGYWVVAFSARATGESAWLLLGLTGMGAAAGMSAFWVVVGEVLGVAVAWSDLFKGSIMLIGLVALPLASIVIIPDISVVWSHLESVDPALTSIWGTRGFSLEGCLVLISFLAIGLGFLGSPQVFVRFMSLRRADQLRQGRWVAVAYTVLTDGAAVLTGIFGRYLLVGDGDLEAILGNAGEGVLPEMAAFIFPPLIVGLYVAAVLSAIMSTIDSLLVVASSALTRDFYQQIYHPEMSGRRLTRLSRVATLLLALLALLIAVIVSLASPGRTIFWYVIFGWSGIAATFCPTIILSLFYKRFTVQAAIAAMCTELLSVPLCQFAFPLIPGAGPYFALVGEMAPAFLLSLMVGVAVSRSPGRK